MTSIGPGRTARWWSTRVLLLLGAFPCVARAQTEPPSEDRIRATLDTVLERFRSPGGPGCVAGVRVGGGPPIRAAAGLASLEFEAPLDTATPIHVGSIGKQFIAAAALELERRELLDLDAPITGLVPELPDRFRAVTGRHLLTHTSGLRDYLQLRHHAGAGLDDPVARDEILRLLARQRRLDFEPGMDVSYSNSNYFLLQSMIERATDQPLDEVVRRLVFEPLGMSASRFLADGLEVVPGRARGYREDGEGGHRVHEPVPGMGGLVTSLDDLLTWAHHLSRSTTERDPLFIELTTPAVLADGTRTREASGLRVDRRFGRRVIDHNGSNRGFNAYLGWYPDEALLLAVMCNVRQAGATSLANEIAAGVLAVERPRRAEYPELSPPSLAGLEPFAGVYQAVEGIGALELEVEAPHAILTLYGAHPSESRTGSNVLEPAEPPGSFSLFDGDDAVRVSFARPDKPLAILRREPAETRTFEKVASADIADVEALAGRYRSEELDVVYVLTVADGAIGLVIERSASDRVDRGPLTPVTRDLYVLARDPVSNIRVTRAGDRITGFELSEPRLRGVVFERP